VSDVNFWQAMIIATIPSFAAVLTAWIGLRDLKLRRRLETSKQFMSLIATAHGHPPDGRAKTAIFEQIAVVHLIADLALHERFLRNAAVADLRGLAEWGETESIRTHGSDKLSREEAFLLEGKRKLGEAAKTALARLEPEMNL
jgi:hypothetical protein